MFKYLVFLFTIGMFSCSSDHKTNFTYIGGKIINPKNNYITLHNSNEEVIDSVVLNPDNTFTGKLKDLTAGLYFLKHGAEFQYIFLEPQDSLLLRLNTWDFHQSLVFSGSNAEINNALNENLLINEKEYKDFYRYNTYNAAKFLKTLDSLTNIKHKYINSFTVNHPRILPEFLDILKVAMFYPLYTKLENYAINNRLKDNPEIINEDRFTAHRSNLNINNDSLVFFYPYRKYVFDNIKYDVHTKNIKDESDAFIEAILETIDEKIDAEKFKNRLLKNTIIRHFYTRSSCNLNQDAVDLFSKFSSNRTDKKEIDYLLNDVKFITKNTKLPNFQLYSPQGSMESINKLTEGSKAVIYFINKEYTPDKWLASRMNYLIKKYPTVNFLVINIEEEKNKYISGLNIKHQFYLHQKSSAHKFLTSKYPRMVLVNSKGIVKNGFCALSSKKIEKQIAELK